MEPLRERKKEQTRVRILASAECLLGERGLEATTMEEIAAGAEVSVGTLYNYFGSKHQLLLALLESETDALIARGAEILARPAGDGPTLARDLLQAYLGLFLDLDRRLLTEVFTAGMSRTALGGGLMNLDLRLMEQVGSLVRRLRGEGRIDPALPLEEATLLLYSVLLTQILFYVAVPAIEPDVVRSQLARQVDLAFAGLGPADVPDAT